MRHLALIMDGNRRWAKQRALRPWLGHNAGTETIREVVRFCLERSISYLSLYAFSLENFKRSPHEVNFLFELFVQQAQAEAKNLTEQGVCVKFIGDRTLFPAQVAPALHALEYETAHNNKLILQLLFCYGAQQEIAEAVKKIAQQVKEGMLDPEQITPAVVTDNLWTGAIPEPELIIRTGGKKRLSNFLLYQAAYSELYFLDCLWPDLRYEHLDQAVSYFQQEQRNFGV